MVHRIRKSFKCARIIACLSFKSYQQLQKKDKKKPARPPVALNTQAQHFRLRLLKRTRVFFLSLLMRKRFLQNFFLNFFILLKKKKSPSFHFSFLFFCIKNLFKWPFHFCPLHLYETGFTLRETRSGFARTDRGPDGRRESNLHFPPFNNNQVSAHASSLRCSPHRKEEEKASVAHAVQKR